MHLVVMFFRLELGYLILPIGVKNISVLPVETLRDL